VTYWLGSEECEHEYPQVKSSSESRLNKTTATNHVANKTMLISEFIINHASLLFVSDIL